MYVLSLTQRKRQKPRDGSTAQTKSAAESAKQMMLQKRWSRRINYDVLNNLFPDASAAQPGGPSGAEADVALDANEPEEDLDDDDDVDDDDAPTSKRARVDEHDWRRLGGLPPAQTLEEEYDEYDL